MQTRHLIAPLVLAGSMGLAPQVWAQTADAGAPTLDVPHLSGGVGVDGRREMQALKGKYNFRLSTVARKSGAYLADVRVRIMDARDRRELLDHRMDGPWFYADLAPGLYEVEVSFQSGDGPVQTRRSIRSMRKGMVREQRMDFDVPDAGKSGMPQGKN